MGTWTTINHQIWEDEEFCALSPEARLLFIFSWTHSPYASIAGLDRARPSAMLTSMGSMVYPDDQPSPVQLAQLQETLEELGAKPLVKYDWDHNLLWAVNRLKYVSPGKDSLSKKAIDAINTHLATLPQESPILSAYTRKYGRLLAP